MIKTFFAAFLIIGCFVSEINSSNVTKDPDYPLIINVDLDNAGTQRLQGLELPLLNNDFEQRRSGDFSNGMTRMISKDKVYLMRVHTKVDEKLPDNIKQIAYLGVDGTYLAAKFFKNAEQAKNYSALLTKWYTARGGLAEYSLIEVPAGTEIYVGNAKTQIDTETIKRNVGKKPRPDKVVTREIRLGGGVQLLIPVKNFLGHQQLSLTNVVSTHSLKTN